jgi:hypothetical protein
MSNTEILFLNSPTQLYPPSGREGSYEKIPPIGLAYVATVAKSTGASVNLIDAEHEGLSPDQIVERVGI